MWGLTIPICQKDYSIKLFEIELQLHIRNMYIVNQFVTLECITGEVLFDCTIIRLRRYTGGIKKNGLLTRNLGNIISINSQTSSIKERNPVSR